MILLSHYQARALLEAREHGEATAVVSPDLNLTVVNVILDETGVCFPDGEHVGWDSVEALCKAENKCFLVEAGDLREIKVFSEATNWLRSLMPTERAPTMLVSGKAMHRIVGIDPHEDTLRKIKALRPVVGQVLDTATGLGYTAIEAAKTAERVVTVEIDPACLEIARLNPWSRDLFVNPRIEQIIGDTWDVIETLEESSFHCIIHDPPYFSLAGELYAGEFYQALYRILRKRGRMFHYIGDPNSPPIRSITRGIARRLREAGFYKIVPKPHAFGVLAYK